MQMTYPVTRDVQQRSSTRELGRDSNSIMIDYENDDRGKKIWIGYSSILGSTLSSDCLARNCMRFKV